MSIRIAQTAKGPIEYRLEGSGPVVLVLNGGHCSRDTRLSHENLVFDHFTVLTPSRPGYDSTPATIGRTAQAAADALAALLDTLAISVVSVIGISAGGPTAIAFAQQYPDRTHKLILESAVTTEWDATLKRHARRLFGRAEKLTWAVVRFALRVMPRTLIKAMMQEFTTLKVEDVLKRMSQDDLRFVTQMFQTMQSGTGFINDIEHRVDRLQTIRAPVLVMYSPHDKSVPVKNAQRVAREVADAELYEVPADSHLIWIGAHAAQVWHKRLAFLQA
jgi:pimeloyl-ACP methyl ester carboxylesterase